MYVSPKKLFYHKRSYGTRECKQEASCITAQLSFGFSFVDTGKCDLAITPYPVRKGLKQEGKWAPKSYLTWPNQCI